MMAWLSEKTFERLGDWISRSTGASQRAFDPLVKRLTPVEEPDSLDWAGDADWARLQQEPSVVSVAGTSISFNQGWSHYGYKVNGEHKSAYVYAVDPYYLHTLGVEMVMGRNFDARIPSDTSAVIVNEALVRDMQWSDPLNEYLNWREDTVGLGAKVVGVVKDYHFLSLEKDIEPLFLSMDKKSAGYLGTMLVKVNASMASMTPPAIASPNDNPNDPAAEFTPAASLIRSSEIGARV